MYAYGSAIPSQRNKKCDEPSEELRVAVTFPRPDREPGPTKRGVHLSLQNIKNFEPEPQKMERGIDELRKLGFKLTGRGRLTVSMKCTGDLFKNVFGTTLEKRKIKSPENYPVPSVCFPPKGAPWKFPPTLAELIDDVYIQWPHLFPICIPLRKRDDDDTPMSLPGASAPPAKLSAKPPKLKDYPLKVPSGIASLLKAKKVHDAGTTGEGVRVVMIDTGFEHTHPFFNGYTSKVVLAGDAKHKRKDAFGHGTGESANIFALAPRVEFIGVKIGTDAIEDFDVEPASLLEGFCKARQQNPDVISISTGWDLRWKAPPKQRANLPRSVKALEAEILHAVASGITVVVAAGNGTFAFPGMMPDVISAGGVYVDTDGNMKASGIASAFDSKIYPGRHVPDFCGILGAKLHGKFMIGLGDSKPINHGILLPVPMGCGMDFGQSAARDGTSPRDGWAAFCGTSTAAPQIAAVCALLKAKNPNLTPSDIKAILRCTARKVLVGHANPKSSDDRKTPQRGAGATGAGLVDAFRAWQKV
jgi:subtilisin family serine protease